LTVQNNFRRIGQNYEVNGMRPESNTFLVDGMRNINRMDGGYAYRPPADSMAEFRILTTTAPAEFGGTSGGITTIVTRSGTNQVHGTLYEFLRNDALDANNYFAPRKEELKQNQYGGTIGGPMVHNHAYFFTYYEGLRENQDITHGVVVPTVAERTWRLLGRCAHSFEFHTMRPSATIFPVRSTRSPRNTSSSFPFPTRQKIRTWPKPQT
jgi:hypothetical protein